MPLSSNQYQKIQALNQDRLKSCLSLHKKLIGEFNM